ncbi:MAG: site-specific integrase [Bacteroidales bacterium]|nr:site-specific integrase [Bacteroidales bacterium]
MNVSVSIVLRLQDVSGKFSVKLRLGFERKSNFIALGIFLSKVEFDKIQRGRRLTPDQIQIKDRLNDSIKKANAIIQTMDRYSFAAFKALFSGEKSKRDNKLRNCFLNYIKDLQSNNQIKSSGMYQTALNSIEGYKKGLVLNDINNKFLKGYQEHLKNKSITTVSLYLRSLRAVINKNRDIVDSYPFENFKIPSPTNNKRAIPEKHINKLLKFSFIKDIDNLYFDLFKFSYYCAGANIKDIAMLTTDNIQDEFLIYNRAKTSKQIRVFLLPQAKLIIERYKNINNSFLFPLLTGTTPQYLYDRVPNVVKSVNKRLKRACEALGVKTITTYSARHSYATILMQKNVSIAFISQSLGHQNISTTQQYLGSFSDNQQENLMKKLIT